MITNTSTNPPSEETYWPPPHKLWTRDLLWNFWRWIVWNYVGHQASSSTMLWCGFLLQRNYQTCERKRSKLDQILSFDWPSEMHADQVVSNLVSWAFWLLNSQKYSIFERRRYKKFTIKKQQFIFIWLDDHFSSNINHGNRSSICIPLSWPIQGWAFVQSLLTHTRENLGAMVELLHCDLGVTGSKYRNSLSASRVELHTSMTLPRPCSGR